MIGVVEKSLVHLVTSSHCSSVARVGEPREQRLQSCFTMFTIWDLSDLWKAIGSCCYTRQEWATGSQVELRLSKRVLPGPKRLAEGRQGPIYPLQYPLEDTAQGVESYGTVI